MGAETGRGEEVERGGGGWARERGRPTPVLEPAARRGGTRGGGEKGRWCRVKAVSTFVPHSHLR
jgi:hypothetical protein